MIYKINVRNDKSLIQAIRKFWVEKGHSTDTNFRVDSINNSNIQVIGITDTLTMNYYSSRNNVDYTNIYSIVDFVNWYHKNISKTKFVVGDKVTITMNNYFGTGTIIKDVSDVIPDPYPNYLVKLDKMIYINPLLTNHYMVINENYLSKIESEPVYIDEVLFIYDGNETKKLSVIKEDDKYIEGHKLGTKEYRKYLKSKIVGNIYRKK